MGKGKMAFCGLTGAKSCFSAFANMKLCVFFSAKAQAKRNLHDNYTFLELITPSRVVFLPALSAKFQNEEKRNDSIVIRDY